MNRIVLGAVSALLLAAAGLFWWQGRAETERAAPALPAAELAPPSGGEDIAIPDEDGAGLKGAPLPSADPATRERKRFDRLDRDRDGRITRNEALAPRVGAFRKLDTDHNNLLSFEEWAVVTANKFKGADANGDNALSRDEFATTKPKERKKPACKC
ncbi:hypothetical protein ACOYW6_03965 [Parablastomonas sp. CN1-191]|jgi:hypothetical protein|uniref:hypothetical protein n=1 Tax=Parablastomonas sp. CN1-191 TaxID=3400908 RepID=UPI003BF86C3A